MTKPSSSMSAGLLIRSSKSAEPVATAPAPAPEPAAPAPVPVAKPAKAAARPTVPPKPKKAKAQEPEPKGGFQRKGMWADEDPVLMNIRMSTAQHWQLKDLAAELSKSGQFGFVAPQDLIRVALALLNRRYGKPDLSNARTELLDSM